MRLRKQQKRKIVRDYAVGWTLAFYFLCIVRGVGTIEEGSVQFNFWLSILFSSIIGPIFGSISALAEILTEERLYKRVSLARLLIVRLTYAFLFLTALIILSYGLCIWLLDIKITLVEFALEPGSFAIYFFILFVDLSMTAMRQVNLLLGEGKIADLLLGRFYTPREEERIFMFLDLQSSTQIAEKLGHVKYSRFIQDCFSDLAVVAENEAEIYQYVGDEAVLTWKLTTGITRNNCLDAYYRYKSELTSRHSHYEKEYGVVPFFKAGVNAGLVTVTEVGRFKKEIAYHGDAINTAARIQGQCNPLGKELLISKYLKDLLKAERYCFEEQGSIELKGKGQEVGIFAVHKSERVDKKKYAD
ncbi:adenylate/guanylate cyclase domain-containing protein [Fulvivirga sedimenti]|uniref:Guanylate cyclase domain-containing protein n=1 Tax=Fulvivirga sedimenti TaxID=2879465 RepID=A0A9X1HY81_9BACT|nr:adenylate/guanylate cyclase domain-containing protein [Fulvivirga sedimenti]MCA6078912.1 hypothetical protein [Fulvivirga sedimenti]